MRAAWLAVWAGGLGLACPAAHGEVDVSTNLALATDYISEGISQTDRGPAVQGGLNLSGPRGLYGGLWASNVDFAENEGAAPGEAVRGANFEIDLYGGVAGELSKVGWDLGAEYYAYPRAERDLHYDYWEINGVLSREFGRLSVSVALSYSPEYFGRSGNSVYRSLDLSIPLPGEILRFGLHLARRGVEDNDAYGVSDYNDWKLSVSKDLGAFALEAAYTDTDLSERACFDGSEVCGPTLALILSRTL